MTRVDSWLLFLAKIILFQNTQKRPCCWYCDVLGWIRMIIIPWIYQSSAIHDFLTLFFYPKLYVCFFSHKIWYLTSGASSAFGWDCPPLLSERSWSLPCPCFVCVPPSSWQWNTALRTPPQSEPSSTSPSHHCTHQRILNITIYTNVS